ncbi:hypothetical protein Btru_071448 [Bulinus truncatus]|nr:hypothetical protein Btru_071448 [Bulinus truncatus]
MGRLELWMDLDSCKQLTINETSRDLVLISPPDRETDQVIQATVRCSLGRRRDDGQWPAESRDVAVTVSVLDVDDSHPHTLYGATQQLVEKETAIKIELEIVNHIDYRFQISRPQNTYDISRPQNTYDISRPLNTYDIIRPQNMYDISRPQNTYDIIRAQNTYDIIRPQNTYDIIRPPEHV